MIKLNERQTLRIAEACTELAAIIMGITILPYIFGSPAAKSPFLGGAISIFLYIASLLLLRKNNND